MPVIVTFEDDGVGDVLLLQFAFLDETEFLFTDAFQKFRCIVAEISDNLAGILMSYIYHNLLTINVLHLMNVTKSSARLSDI